MTTLAGQSNPNTEGTMIQKTSSSYPSPLTGALYFVRHGESRGNGWPEFYADDDVNFLSAYGSMQASLCGHYFKRTEVKFTSDQVYSSGMTRARHTTAIILDELHLMEPWCVLPKLNELRYNSERETIARTKALVTEFQTSILRPWTEKGGNALIVTHMFSMQAMFQALGIVQYPRFIPNAAPYKVVFAEGSPQLEKLNMSDTGAQY